MILFNLLSSSTSATPGSCANGGTWIFIAFFAVLLVIMMITSSRSNKKRQKEAEDKLNNMRIGDKVKTIGGICGIVVEINPEENTFVLSTGVDNEGTLIKFDMVAVYQTAHPEDEQQEAPVEEAAEAPAEEATEAPAEEATEATNEEAAEAPAEQTEEENK